MADSAEPTDTSLLRFTWPVFPGLYRWRRSRAYDVGRDDDRTLYSPARLKERLKPEPEWVLFAPWGDADPTFQYDPLADEPALFRTFAELDPADRDAITAFADRYGCLGEHEPVFHPERDRPGHYSLGETLDTWQFNVNRMRMSIWLMDLIAAADSAELGRHLTRDETKPGGVVLWRISFEALGLPWDQEGVLEDASAFVGPEAGDPYDVLCAARWLLYVSATRRLQTGLGLRLVPVPGSDTPELHIQPNSLLTAIWLQHVQAIAGGLRFQHCRTCDKWFGIPAKADARTTRREFCSDACKTRLYRARKAKAIEMAEAGASVKEIAKETGTEPETVRGWINDIKKRGGGRGT